MTEPILHDIVTKFDPDASKYSWSLFLQGGTRESAEGDLDSSPEIDIRRPEEEEDHIVGVHMYHSKREA